MLRRSAIVATFDAYGTPRRQPQIVHMLAFNCEGDIITIESINRNAGNTRICLELEKRTK